MKESDLNIKFSLDEIKNSLNSWLDQDISKETYRRILKSIGYKYGRAKIVHQLSE